MRNSQLIFLLIAMLRVESLQFSYPALNCKKVGLVTLRHIELKVLNIKFVNLVGLTQTVKEPIMKDSDGKGKGRLRAVAFFMLKLPPM